MIVSRNGRYVPQTAHRAVRRHHLRPGHRPINGLREVTVDLERKLVHAGGGCRLGDVDAATAPHKLIVPAGIMSETGVAGLSLSGGIGWFSRKHGTPGWPGSRPGTTRRTSSG